MTRIYLALLILVSPFMEAAHADPSREACLASLVVASLLDSSRNSLNFSPVEKKHRKNAIQTADVVEVKEWSDSLLGKEIPQEVKDAAALIILAAYNHKDIASDVDDESFYVLPVAKLNEGSLELPARGRIYQIKVGKYYVGNAISSYRRIGTIEALTQAAFRRARFRFEH